MTRLEKRLGLAEAWLEKAEGDLETARAGEANERIPAWVVGFHLQQALEKTWKGRLVVLGARPPAVHDLRMLLEARLGQSAPSEELVRLIERLQPFAVEERYPLLTPRDAGTAELIEVLPDVESEVAALRSAIEDARPRPDAGEGPPPAS